MGDLFSLAAMEAEGRRRQMLRTAFGPAIAAALADPAVIEVMVNPDGRLRLDRPAGTCRYRRTTRCGRGRADHPAVAAHVHREVHDGAPIVSAELPETGERFEGLLPPVATAPCFSIRKPAGEDLFARRLCRGGHRIAAPGRHAAHRGRGPQVDRSIAGGTSLRQDHAGQCAAGRDRRARRARDHDRGHARAAMRGARIASRCAPGRASRRWPISCARRCGCGPTASSSARCAGAEALDMLKAWNTGHPGGIATVHANSALSALYRLEQLVQEARRSPCPAV